MAVAAAPLLAGVASSAFAAETTPVVGNGPISARAYGASKAASPLTPIQIQRRALGSNDFCLMCCIAVCHSDIHHARGEWPTNFPCVPGHEIIGRVQEVGSAVTKFKVGDIGGVGCMVNACGTCENCLADREQN